MSGLQTVPPLDSQAQNAKPRYYRPELDWVRFLAFLGVFVAHAFSEGHDSLTRIGIPMSLAEFIYPLVYAGFYGVDLFFALSAFLITELLLREKEVCGRIDIKAFYIRRILRIWPLYFAFLFVFGPFDIFVRKTGLLSYYAAMLLFAGNWHYLFFFNVWSLAAHLWSISVEEQFYVTWPFLMKARTTARIAAILSLLIVVSFAARLLIRAYDPETPFAYWTNTFARLDPFACGGLLALLMHKQPFCLSPIVRMAVLVLSMVLAGFVGSYGDEGTFSKAALITFPTAAVASALLILAFVSGTPLQQPKSAILRTWSYLGKISYGLYMFHIPGLIIAELLPNPTSLTPEHWWIVGRLFAVLFTLLAAMLSYALLEKPFLQFKNRFAHVQSRPA